MDFEWLRMHFSSLLDIEFFDELQGINAFFLHSRHWVLWWTSKNFCLQLDWNDQSVRTSSPCLDQLGHSRFRSMRMTFSLSIKFSLTKLGIWTSPHEAWLLTHPSSPLTRSHGSISDVIRSECWQRTDEFPLNLSCNQWIAQIEESRTQSDPKHGNVDCKHRGNFSQSSKDNVPARIRNQFLRYPMAP